jgi:hypothetical protein
VLKNTCTVLKCAFILAKYFISMRPEVKQIIKKQILTYIPTDFVTGKKMEGFNQYKNYTMLKRGKMRNYIIIVKMYLPKKFENRRGINQ